MTVNELIEALKQFDSQAPVYFETTEVQDMGDYGLSYDVTHPIKQVSVGVERNKKKKCIDVVLLKSY